jgi:outer membrane protein assembly factor BamE (lipoprotein component of BamABCDE complex)
MTTDGDSVFEMRSRRRWRTLPLNIAAAMGVFLFVVSCGTSRRALNVQHMAHLKKGMTKHEVVELMGRPLENEVYNTDNVWYYFIESKWSDGIISRDECLPIFFEEDKVVGWGQKEYKKYRQRNW